MRTNTPTHFTAGHAAPPKASRSPAMSLILSRMAGTFNPRRMRNIPTAAAATIQPTGFPAFKGNASREARGEGNGGLQRRSQDTHYRLSSQPLFSASAP